MNMYVANYFTTDEQLAEADDPSFGEAAIWELASPKFAAIGPDLDRVADVARHQCWVEVWETLHIVDDDPQLTWELDLDRCDETPPNGGRPFWSWVLQDEDGDVQAYVVVQKVELVD